MNLNPVQAFDAWVAALHSGQYRQGRGRLTRVDAQGQKFHCCLGVACEVMLKAEGPESLQVYQDSLDVSYDGDSAALPVAVRDWLGMSTFCGVAQFAELPAGIPATACHKSDDHVSVTLVGLNDRGEWTFDQIADFLTTHREKFLVQE